MATLEKIRKRSVLLFIVIIGALLAFILGDFLTSGRSFTGPGDTVAKAKGVKVDYTTYQERVSQAADQAKSNPQYADIDQAILDQQVIDELLLEKLLDKEYESLGIAVTDKQISKLFFDEKFAPATFQQLMQQFGQGAMVLYQHGITDTRAYADAMKNPGKYQLQAEDAQTLTAVWKSTEETFDQQLRQQAFGTLIGGLYNANEVDAKAAYEDRNVTTQFAYVRKDLSAINDKDVKLTDEDYQKYYDEHKGMFKLNEETRVVKAIVVPVQPSAADYEAGAMDANALVAELQATAGTDALRNHKNFAGKTENYTRATLAQDARLRTLVGNDSTATPLAIGTVRQLQSAPGSFAVAKVTDINTGIDKVKFSVFQLPIEADSVFNTLTLANFDSIAQANQGTAGYELSLVNPGNTMPKIADALKTKAVGEIFFLTDTVNGQDAKGAPVQQVAKTAMLITERDLPTEVYTVTVADYTVVPSSNTVNDLNTRLHAYVANNATTETFVKNAEKSGYTVIDAVVTPSTPSISNAKGSRNAVKWAMTNDKGKVSHVFNQTTGDYLMAVAVQEIFDGEYVPVSSEIVREQIKPAVMADKKAEMLIKQYSGKAKDLAGYASAMGTPVTNAESVFAEGSIPSVGFNEGTLQGVVAGAAKGKLTGPFKSNNGIFVVSVTGQTKAGRPYNYKEDAANFSQQALSGLFGTPQAMLQTLLGNETITNNILEFTSAE